MGSTQRAWRALDLTIDRAGAYASRLLSAAGVQVTRVEPPGGHPLRRWRAGGPPPQDGDGALFRWLAGGQEALTADPAVPDDVEAVLAWASASDVVLWGRGAVVPLDRLTSLDGGPAVVTVTPFGTDGPWADRPATEFTLQALSGGPALRGSRSWPPMTAGGQLGDHMVGVVAAVAAMLALRQGRRRSDLVDVSGLEAVIMTQLFNPITMETQANGVRPRRALATVADVVPTSDGYVGFAVVNRVQHWIDFCLMIGREDWADDTTLHAVPARTARSAELNPVIEAWARARTTAEIVELAALWRIPCIEVGNGETVWRMAQFVEGFFDVNPDGGFLQPAAPFRAHPPIPGMGTVAPAPGPGAPVRTRPRPALWTPVAPPVDGAACEGLRVADLTSFWAGPFLTHTLAMFGADVIHVEATGRLDGARLMNHHPRTTPRWWERSPYFHGTNTNKRGVTIDLTSDAGRQLGRRLVAACDVLVENYSPRVLDSFGLSWDEVHRLNPSLVMVRMPAFGLSGPWRDRTGFAMTMEQVSGMAWVTGFPEHDPGALFGPCDPSAGLHALVGLLAALEHRRRTGEGRLVECPMVASALHVAGEQVVEFTSSGVRLDRQGNRGPAAAPQNCYQAADHDPDLDQRRWVAVAVADDEQWQALVRVLGEPGWARHPDLATAPGRAAHHDRIDAELAAWCAARPAGDIADLLCAAGVPAAAVVHPSAQLGFEQLHHRRFFETVEHPVHGSSVHVTYPFRPVGHDGPVHRRPAPMLGEHHAAVLGDLLGLTPGEIAALEASGVIGTEPST